MGWNLVLSLVAVPVGGLYLNSLVSFTPSQLRAVVIHLAWIPSMLFVFSALHHGWLLNPVMKTVDDIDAGRDVDEIRLKQAEFRALLFPYLNLAGGVFWFTVGGAVLAAIMKRFNGLSGQAAFFILACSITTGFVAGLLYHYSAKYPMRRVVSAVLEKRSRTGARPKFFVPLMAKQIATFVIVLSLVLSFLGFYSFMTASEVFKETYRSEQSDALVDFGTILDSVADDEKAQAILQAVSTADKAHCLTTAKFEILFCAGQFPTSEALKSLGTVNWAEIILDEQTSWTWSWTETASGMRIVNGWAPPDMSEIERKLRNKYLLVGLVIIIVGVGLGILAASDVAGPIEDLSKAAMQIAEGNIDVALPPGREDETGVMARAFMKMTGVLLNRLKGELGRGNEMLASIREAVEALAPMSQQLVVISEQQSNGSIKQAAAAEEAAVTSQQVAEVSRQIAEGSAGISDSAEQAMLITQAGSDRLEHTKGAFDDINLKMADIASSVEALEGQSAVIEGIIAIIEEISSQTSLLAFNASIEAVGAGVHGKRFGVVAHEIQRLAKNTAESIDNIRDIVARMREAMSASVQKTVEGEKSVSSGKAAIEDMSKLFKTIFNAASGSTTSLKEINLMMAQQASASGQMASTLEEVRETARQSSDASLELRSAVGELEKIVISLKTHLEHEKEELSESSSPW